jgi:hypothetical protein
MQGLVRRQLRSEESDRMTSVAQLVVQLGGAGGPRWKSRTPYPIRVCPYRASVTRTSAATIASIAERIESRLAAMANLEAAIREDLALLAFVDEPHPGERTADDRAGKRASARI